MLAGDPRFNLRRYALDILAPVLATAALYKLFHAAAYIEPSAPVSAWLLRAWLVAVVAVGMLAVHRIGCDYE